MLRHTKRKQVSGNMRAVFYHHHGDAGVLQPGELATPPLQDDEVLVQVGAASVNPIDRRLRAGELQEYLPRTFPVVPGFDLSGRIVRVGRAVSDWQVGDEVFGLSFTWSVQHGTYAEYAPVRASAIARKPAWLSHVEAASLPLVTLTAWQSLAEFAQLSAGQSVLVQAGAGGVGSLAIPIAKHLGAHVYTTASAANAEYVRGLGADVVIDYRNEDYAAVIRTREPEGVDVVLESILTDAAIETAMRLVKPGGAVAFMNNEPPDIPDLRDKPLKAAFVHHRADGASLQQLLELFERGVLRVPEIRVMDLCEAAEAHRLSEAGHTRGKIVLRVQDL